MPVAPISHRDLAPLVRRLGADGPAALRRGVLSGALRCVGIMQVRGDAAGVFDRGRFRQSWAAWATTNGARLLNTAPYAPIIEEGRRPGARMPPPAVIERWAKRKLALSPDEAAAAAFPIARAIAARGIPGKHLLREARPVLVQVVTDEARRELEAAVRAAAAAPRGRRP